jgi:ferredoxin-like protein FixX
MVDKIEASLDINLFVECPSCEETINLMDPEQTSGVDHNDCGELLMQACPSEGYWSDSHEKFKLKDVACTDCNFVFSVDGIAW